MSDGVGPRLKAVAVFLVMVILLSAGFTGTLAGKASASASLRKYLMTPPSGWVIPGSNVNGSAARFVVDTLGWNATKMMGNVGIGDGSVRTLNRTSNQEINYTGDYIIAADVSTAPWDLSRVGGFNLAAGNASVQKANDTGQIDIGNMGSNMGLNDAYHSILLGRPVDDLLYEYPHARASNVYVRLMGFRLPGGSYVNVGIRSIGYGY